MRVKYQTLGEKEFIELLKGRKGVLTYGNGLNDINVFKRYNLRKGSGQLNIGHGIFTNILAKYGPRIVPFLQKYLLPAAKQMGSNVAADVLSGKVSLKKSLKTRGKESLKHMGAKIIKGDGSYISRKKKNKLNRRKKYYKRIKNIKKVKKCKKIGGGKKMKKKRISQLKTRKDKRQKIKTKKSLKRKISFNNYNNKKKSRSMKSLDCSRPSNRKMCHDIFSS